jgi:hypothetical protein
MLEPELREPVTEPGFADRLLDDTGSVIEELGFKGLMIAAALAAGGVVALAVAAWAGAIPTP